MTIAFVGLSGALKRTRACDIRLAMFANLMAENNKVIVVNRYSALKDLSFSNIKLEDDIEQHELITPRRTGKMLSVLYLIASVLIEPFYLIKKNRKDPINFLHVYSGHYFDFLLYHLVARIIGARVLYQYVEYKSTLDPRSLYDRVNNYLCDNRGPKLWDGVIAISSYLENAALRINEHLKTIRIPPICDFTLFDSIRGESFVDSQYILYCGSIGYLEVVRLILESYRQSVLSHYYKLVLVLSGDKKEIELFANDNQDIIVYYNLAYNDLIALYKNASLLLIPLRNNIRDIARFPNKICEYLASKGAIVTTAVGEINTFFEDGESAIIAQDYSVESLKKVLDRVSNGDYDLLKIKRNAYRIGKDFFNSSSVKDSLNSFLNEFELKTN